MASVYSALLSVTEPVLAPLRSVIPPIGMIDISPMVLFFGLILLQRVVC
jgi:YggT family protein